MGSKAWVYVRLLAGITGSNNAIAWMCFSGECCVLPGRDFCYGLISKPEESYRGLCVSVIEEPHKGVLSPLWLSMLKKIKNSQQIFIINKTMILYCS